MVVYSAYMVGCFFKVKEYVVSILAEIANTESVATAYKSEMAYWGVSLFPFLILGRLKRRWLKPSSRNQREK